MGLKESTIRDYLDGKGSMTEYCDKSNISKHNSDINTTGGKKRMTYVRKTTLEERITKIYR